MEKFMEITASEGKLHEGNIIALIKQTKGDISIMIREFSLRNFITS